MLDISTLLIEEVITRLRVAKDLFPYATTVSVNDKLLHTKEEGNTRKKEQQNREGTSNDLKTSNIRHKPSQRRLTFKEDSTSSH